MLEPLPFCKYCCCRIVGTISHMYQVPHSPYLANHLSNMYNCYLAIIWETDQRISIELGCEDCKWAMKNVCTPCLYKTEDEPKLKFEFLGAMNSNNSLKLVDSTYHAGTVQTDSQRMELPHWIKPEDVDLFKDEVGKVKSFLPKPHTFHDHSSSEQPRYPSRSTSPCRSYGRSCNRRNCMAQCYGTWWTSQVLGYLHWQMVKHKPWSMQEVVHPVCCCRHLFVGLPAW